MLISEAEALAFLSSDGKCLVSSGDLHEFVECALLPSFASQYLSDDLSGIKHSIRDFVENSNVRRRGRNLFSNGLPAELAVNQFARLATALPSNKDLSYYAAARNLIEYGGRRNPESGTEECEYFGGSLKGLPPVLADFVALQKSRISMATPASGFFANSSSYMGSKRSLSGFLVEALAPTMTDDSVILDLMCGSGAASAAFSSRWRTTASDALDFCQHLARVQGGGYSRMQAGRSIDMLLPLAKAHASELVKTLQDYVAIEDEIFHSNIGVETVERYRRLIDSFPNFGSNIETNNRILARQNDHSLRPYCLFTYYFSNIFFGVRQSIEIDSIKYAIDQLQSQIDRSWAMGALVVAVSTCGTTYGGHFAQPKYKSSQSISTRSCPGVIERRAMSIMQEFSKRLMSLAAESESHTNPIEIMPGPWKTALESWHDRVTADDRLVYVDAPYKREEYSRYYHVLQTLCRYNYPASCGKGRMPDRSQGQLFESEFFTRRVDRVNATFVSIINAALQSGAKCAWSYSSSGTAQVPEIINAVERSNKNLSVKSYVAPYEYKPQGGHKAKRVNEFVIVFQKN